MSVVPWSPPSLPELECHFRADDGVAAAYLRDHYPRFRATWQAYAAGPRGQERGRMLDIGSHWLHQTLIWRLAGFEVAAVDIAATVEVDYVRSLALQHGISLIRNDSLEHPEGLSVLPENGFDLILLSEVIEHLAFNPVPLWRQLYRILAPGGRVVVTTPNYYALRGRVWRPWRFLSGRGGGLTVREILTVPSFGHHWREFALAELREYMHLLSPDFHIERALRLPHHYRNHRLGSVLNAIERLVPPLRDQLYLEIGIRHKEAGINVTQSW